MDDDAHVVERSATMTSPTLSTAASACNMCTASASRATFTASEWPRRDPAQVAVVAAQQRRPHQSLTRAERACGAASGNGEVLQCAGLMMGLIRLVLA